MFIELVEQDAHDAIGEFAKTHSPEKENNTGFKEKISDIALDDNPVKAGVVKYDVV